MRTLFEFEINEVDDWRRYHCIKTPISDLDSNACVTIDGPITICKKCRYYVKNVVRT